MRSVLHRAPHFPVPCREESKGNTAQCHKKVFNQLHKSYYHCFTAIKFAKPS